MKEPVWLSEELIMAVHRRHLAEFGGLEGVRDVSLLQSALGRPQNLFAYGKAGLHELAASYAFAIVRNHPFLDGNKRTGFLAAALFLDLNGIEFTATEADAALKTLALAARDLSEAAYVEWLKANSQRSG